MKKTLFVLSLLCLLMLPLLGCDRWDTDPSKNIDTAQLSSDGSITTPDVSEITGAEFVLTLNPAGDGYILSDVLSVYSTTLVLPSSAHGLPVTEIGEYAFSETNIQALFIPDSIKLIGRLAFANCEQLTEVHMGNGVTEIKSSVFLKCKKLTDVTLSKNLISLGYGSFSDCERLEEIILPTGLKSIEDYAFYKCTALKQIRIPDQVPSLGESVFSECSSLEKLILGKETNFLSHHAISDCPALTYHSYQNALYLGSEENPYQILIKASGTEIRECSIHPDTKQILKSAFQDCTRLEEIQIPNGVLELGEYAFQDCLALKRVTLGTGISELHTSTFLQCTALTEITIPGNVKIIDNSVFRGCTELQTVRLEEGILEIKTEAFSLCTKLTGITLPASLQKIDKSAFRYITDLKELIFVDPDNWYWLVLDAPMENSVDLSDPAANPAKLAEHTLIKQLP